MSGCRIALDPVVPPKEQQSIEGLIPSGTMNDRRLSSATEPAAPPVKADIGPAEWLREQQHQSAGEEPGDPAATGEAQPTAPQAPASVGH
jgi:hypothetical protein